MAKAGRAALNQLHLPVLSGVEGHPRKKCIQNFAYIIYGDPTSNGFTEQTRINLEVRADNDRAITFYRNHGFRIKRTVRRYYSDGAAALKMTKEI